eukprot:57019-Eustigmatos_ZCMA.PRE.1
MEISLLSHCNATRHAWSLLHIPSTYTSASCSLILLCSAQTHSSHQTQNGLGGSSGLSPPLEVDDLL